MAGDQPWDGGCLSACSVSRQDSFLVTLSRSPEPAACLWPTGAVQLVLLWEGSRGCAPGTIARNVSDYCGRKS